MNKEELMISFVVGFIVGGIAGLAVGIWLMRTSN